MHPGDHLEAVRRVHRRRRGFPASVEVFGHTLSIGTEIAIVVVLAVILIALAVRGLSRAE